MAPRYLLLAVAAVALAAAGIAHAGLRSGDLATAGRPDPAPTAAPATQTKPAGTGQPAPRDSGQPLARAQPLPYQPPKVRSSRTPLPKLTTAQPQPVDDSLDGCDNAYGTLDQCVPWTFPAGTQDGCQWLADHGFGPLQVHGRDRHGLDRNGDGIACAPGD